MFKQISLIFFAFFFASQSVAAPAKVSAVIPVNFNGKGLHAPAPYSQQLMERGWTRVPTMNLPFTFSGGSKFNPTRVSRTSLARSMGKAAANVSRLNPAVKAALALYGAYELNCMSGSYPGMCFTGEWEGDIPPAGAEHVGPYDGTLTKCTAFNGAVFYIKGQKTGAECAIEGKSKYQGARMAAYNAGRECPSQVVENFPNAWTVQDYAGNPTCYKSGAPFAMNAGTSFAGYITGKTCPPEDEQSLDFSKMATVKINGVDTQRCFKPKSAIPVTPAWVEEQIVKNPAPVGNLGLGDFVDPTTGAPDPNLFENPSVDDVSDAFREAAEAAARGTLQSSNPNAEGYVPPNIHQEFLVQLNNWYDGNTFTDVFTNKPVQPDAPPAETVKTDWTDFPGITQKQYEASNNAWAQTATAGAADINHELSKVDSEFTKLTDEINNIPDSLPFPDINLADLVLFPSGGCTGFTVDVTLAGEPKTITVDKHCPPYDAWGRPFVEWVLTILTILVIFHVFRRTLEVA